MIFPLLNGFVNFRLAPVTWALVILNLMMFSLTSRLGVDAQDDLDRITRDDFFIRTQGRVYARYLADHAGPDSAVVTELAAAVNDGDLARVDLLGQLAFRDEAFVEATDEVKFDADPVAFQLWRTRAARLRADQDVHPSFQLGVNVAHASLTRWVTYIFVHGGAMHLIGNMLFLLLFGAALEAQIGGLGVLMTFVGSGVVAAGAFALMTGFTSSPLVGASGAISGVMALYCALNWTRPVRYFRLLLPWPGYAGWVFLPAWIALALWGAADVAGFVGTLPELGGVAHAAHLGGDVAGLAVGLGLRFLNRSSAGSGAAGDPARVAA